MSIEEVTELQAEITALDARRADLVAQRDAALRALVDEAPRTSQRWIARTIGLSNVAVARIVNHRSAHPFGRTEQERTRRTAARG